MAAKHASIHSGLAGTQEAMLQSRRRCNSYNLNRRISDIFSCTVSLLPVGGREQREYESKTLDTAPSSGRAEVAGGEGWTDLGTEKVDGYQEDFCLSGKQKEEERYDFVCIFKKYGFSLSALSSCRRDENSKPPRYTKRTEDNRVGNCWPVV